MRISVTIGLGIGLFIANAALATPAANGPRPLSMTSHGEAFQWGIIPRTVTREQVDALRPSVLPRVVQERGVLWAREHSRTKLSLSSRPQAKQSALYVTDDSGYIFVMDTGGTKVLNSLSDCNGPEGAKVDHRGDLWVACTNSSTINMYKPGATAATLTLNDSISGLPYFVSDVAFDKAGNLYAASLYAYFCSSSGCTFMPGQLSYWTPANLCNGCMPSGQVNDPNLNGEAFFLDSTQAGVLYVDYYGCIGSSNCGYALDQIQQPLTKPAVTTPIPFGQIGYPGGVYIDKSQDINVLDQSSGVMTQYNANPFGILKVRQASPQNIQGTCDPVAFGFNLKGDIAMGDSGCHALVLGKPILSAPWVVWTDKFNIDFSLPVSGAYLPSDK